MRKEFEKTCSLTPTKRFYKYSYLLRPIASTKSKIFDITCKSSLKKISKDRPDCEFSKFREFTKETQHRSHLSNFSKILREKSSKKFLDDQAFRAKVNELRKFNMLNICEDKSTSKSPVYTSIKSRANFTHARIAESVCGGISKRRIYLRERPARFLPTMNVRKINEKNKSCSLFNPALKEDLQIIVNHSSYNSNKRFKEEQIYLSYLNKRGKEYSRTMS